MPRLVLVRLAGERVGQAGRGCGAASAGLPLPGAQGEEGQSSGLPVGRRAEGRLAGFRGGGFAWAVAALSGVEEAAREVRVAEADGGGGVVPRPHGKLSGAGGSGGAGTGGGGGGDAAFGGGGGV